MEFKIRKSSNFGKTTLDWLEGKHGFSFGRYHDESNINFGKLIVFNDDIIAPAKGFGAHPHDNAEIFTFVLNGELEHKDSAGNQGIIKEYEIQRISAGSGIWHSEFNASKKEKAHILQIWLEPKNPNTTPSYEHKSFIHLKEKQGIFKLLSGNPEKDQILIDQDAEFYIGYLKENKENPNKNKITKDLDSNRGFYIYILDGSIKIEKTHILNTGDSIEISNKNTNPSSNKIEISLNSKEANFVLIDVPL